MSETTTPDAPYSPGCAPLPMTALKALLLAARIPLMDARTHVGTRLAAGDSVERVEADLDAIVERMLRPLRGVLGEIPVESGLAACYVTTACLLREALVGDLRVAHILAAVTTGRAARQEGGGP